MVKALAARHPQAQITVGAGLCGHVHLLADVASLFRKVSLPTLGRAEAPIPVAPRRPATAPNRSAGAPVTNEEFAGNQDRVVIIPMPAQAAMEVCNVLLQTPLPTLSRLGISHAQRLTLMKGVLPDAYARAGAAALPDEVSCVLITSEWLTILKVLIATDASDLLVQELLEDARAYIIGNLEPILGPVLRDFR
jgi:hypothetical protein